MTDHDVALPQFALAVRGYDRQQVDDYVARLGADLEEAHARAVLAERALQQGAGGPSASPPALPLTGLASSAGARRGRSGARGLAGAAVALVLVAGAGAVAVATSGDERPDVPTAVAPEVPSLPALAAGVADRRETAGSAVDALLGALRQLDALSGVDRQARSLSLARDIENAAAGGELTPEIVQLARPSLVREATPMSVPGLVDVLAVRPDAAGQQGPQVLQRLQSLGEDPDPQAVREVAGLIRAGAEGGTLTPAFRDVALPVLERVARQTVRR